MEEGRRINRMWRIKLHGEMQVQRCSQDKYFSKWEVIR